MRGRKKKKVKSNEFNKRKVKRIELKMNEKGTKMISVRRIFKTDGYHSEQSLEKPVVRAGTRRSRIFCVSKRELPEGVN
jgi:hypothetical protein